MPPQSLPTINLPVFDGPLDLLLHLVREHRVDIADIPISEIADQYIGYINAMEERNLALAGEFFVMAATLLEIKTRMLLPKPPAEATGDDDIDDPRAILIERLRSYERYKELVGHFQELEEARGKLFLRDQPDLDELYRIPVEFGELSADSLVRALQQLLAETGPEEHDVTSVRRQKMSLKLAMRLLIGQVEAGGKEGIDFVDAFPVPRVRLDIIMVFLAMLELLRQGNIRAKQIAPLAPIRIYIGDSTLEGLD